MNKYIVGIDIGSQSAKILIFDLEGNIVCEGKEPLKPMNIDDKGLVEHPDDDVFEALCKASKMAMNAFTGNKEDIIGIGVGGIRCCRVLMKEDGTLSAPIISWMDTRVSVPYQQDIPETAYVTSVSGYLTARLTGEFKDCISNYFGQFPVDNENWCWSDNEDVLKQYNIKKEQLLEANMPGSVVGKITKAASELTGLPEGLDVVCVAADKPVEALGAGLLYDKTAVISLGTYIAIMVSGKEYPENPQTFWPIMSSVPNRYIYEGYGIRRGMWTISWLRDLFGEKLVKEAEEKGISLEDVLNQKAMNVPAGCDGLMTVLDWLAFPDQPFKRGIMIGFQGHMNEGFMYRSLLESIVFTLKNNCENLLNELETTIDELIITGGGSNSDLFMQIFADVFGVPTKRNAVNGAASIGAVINTAVAVGAYKSYEEAVEKMVKIKDVFYPNEENSKVYDRLNRMSYQKITKYTDEVLKNTYEALNG